MSSDCLVVRLVNVCIENLYLDKFLVVVEEYVFSENGNFNIFDNCIFDDI